MNRKDEEVIIESICLLSPWLYIIISMVIRLAIWKEAIA